MPRPLIAHIDLQALQHNYAQVKSRLTSANAFAVIKANAYGHGIYEVAHALKNKAAGFALVEIEYACELRERGITEPILLLAGVFDTADLLLCQQYDLMITVHHHEQVNWLSQLTCGPKLTVFLKVNSGMNRLGIKPTDVPYFLERLAALPRIKETLLMTHFATADEKDKGITAQWPIFEGLMQAYPHLSVCAANSAAVFAYPETHGQWVRPGVVLYGSSPFEDMSAEILGLKPVMSLQSEIIAIQDLIPGQVVGYGAHFTADKKMRVGIVACGYADGYPRHAPSGTPVCVEEVNCGLVGRVSMDMLCVDISHIPRARVGSQVQLWGNRVSIDTVAQFAGTIGYELMCAINPRVKRTYSVKYTH